MILAGDIGGTKTALALYDDSEETLCQIREATFRSVEHPGLETILAEFLTAQESSALYAACFGVAGPVVDGRVQATNLSWIIEVSALADLLHLPVVKVKLLNDLEATALGMLHLAPDEFTVLNPGLQRRHAGNMAVIAAGTGLGEAILVWDGNRFHPIATEGGHASFAPVDDLQIALLKDLRNQLDGHVSFERVLSGPGLFNIYTFLRRYRQTAEPAWLTAALQVDDPAPIISRHGVSGDDSVCREAIELFASIYGAEAGNLALKCMGIGGVLIGGGIAPRILSVLQNGEFMRQFVNKGRFADFLRGIEVKVALNPRAPLLGAAYTAAAMASFQVPNTWGNKT
jgi:glucokinase